MNNSAPNPYLPSLESDRWTQAAFPSLTLAIATAILLPMTVMKMTGGDWERLAVFTRIVLCTVPAQILLFLPVAIVASFVDPQMSLWRKLGLTNWKPTYGMETICVAAGLIPTLYVSVVAGEILLNALGIESVPPIEALLGKADAKGLLLIFVTAVFVAPVVEELAFRRVMFGFLRKHLGTIPALVLVSAVFATVHGSYVQILPLFLLAAVLQLLYIRHNSIIPCIILHFLNNLIAMSIFCLIKLFAPVPS